jgi:hypothetical protein
MTCRERELRFWTHSSITDKNLITVFQNLWQMNTAAKLYGMLHHILSIGTAINGRVNRA